MPPTGPRFHLDIVSNHRLRIEICGLLDDLTTDDLLRRATETLALSTDIKEVLVDIRRFDDSSASARTSLGSLQKLLARRRVRTAWLASTPRMQGLARMIVIRVDDQGAATFITTEQADAWFRETSSRIDGIIAKVGRQA